MNAYDWQRLSEFHNTWLEAGAPERHQLRARLADEQPALIHEADALLASSGALPRFLETPALVVAAHEIARETLALTPGDQVGPYRIVGVLAHGGMGDVYRATDVRLHRDVAVKMLAQAAAPESDQISRFIQEARITAALDHPNIVRVFDVGVFRGHPYMVGELLAGETLRTRLAAGPASIADARQIAADIARGLTAAHEAGLVHRDLKPENVFLTNSGTTKILDFGIAKLLRPRSREEGSSTLNGVILGTTGYLAPEQIDGAAVDGRADLFALGAILFETLTGDRAFGRGHTVAALHDVVHGPAPRVEEHRADVPATLAAVTNRLLE
ncbi:MAG: serine/threonine-protein kinase, partial [Acidobacteriota bacterium]